MKKKKHAKRVSKILDRITSVKSSMIELEKKMDELWFEISYLNEEIVRENEQPRKMHDVGQPAYGGPMPPHHR